jgi:hypothetical protein
MPVALVKADVGWPWIRETDVAGESGVVLIGNGGNPADDKKKKCDESSCRTFPARNASVQRVPKRALAA